MAERGSDAGGRPRFTARTTHFVRMALLGLVLTASAAALTVLQVFNSPYWNRVGLALDQPILFSHRHHAGELRIDCRFCHTTVETSAQAGLPATQTCLICHSQLFRDAPMLRALHASAEENRPLVWSRVTQLPEHVHFDHSIHVAKGIACSSCHGDVTEMALTAKAHPLTMRECLRCHRDPEPQRVAVDEVTTHGTARERMDGAVRRTSALGTTRSTFESGRGVAVLSSTGGELTARPLTSCSTCHH